jgi:hypothetical protein
MATPNNSSVQPQDVRSTRTNRSGSTTTRSSLNNTIRPSKKLIEPVTNRMVPAKTTMPAQPSLHLATICLSPSLGMPQGTPISCPTDRILASGRDLGHLPARMRIRERTGGRLQPRQSSIAAGCGGRSGRIMRAVTAVRPRRPCPPSTADEAALAPSGETCRVSALGAHPPNGGRSVGLQTGGRDGARSARRSAAAEDVLDRRRLVDGGRRG